MVWTNLGKQRMFEEFFCSGAVDATFRLCLASSVGTWTADTSSTQQVSAVSSLPGTDIAGDVIGGTSGLVVIRDSVADQLNFDVSTAAQIGSSAVQAVLQTGANAFQYSGAFAGARYVLLAAAGAQDSTFDFTADNEIYAWWDIGSAQTIDSGNTLTVTSLSLQGQ
jgi:hypothetical protein